MNTTALLIVDMLRDFTDPEGSVFYPENRNILPKICKVLEQCREKGYLIIFLQHWNRKDKIDPRISGMRKNCIEGSFGIEIDPMLQIDEKKDYVIRKRRYSGFFATDLDLVLRQNHIENLLIVGTKTNCCIRATVTDAFYLDYNPIVFSDCVATNDEIVNKVHLQDIKKYFGQVMESDEWFRLEEEKVNGKEI